MNEQGESAWDIWFFDEGRFGLQPTTGKLWCRKSIRPTARICPGYRNFYLYAAINPVTGEQFTLQLPAVNTDMMNLYLNHFKREYPERRILLVLDQAGWHLSKELIIPQGIEFETLPPYSPELNPVERLWRWLRMHVCRNRLFSSLNDLEQALMGIWPKLNPDMLKSLCHVSYL